MKLYRLFSAAAITITLLISSLIAMPGISEEADSERVLFANVNIFNGTDDRLNPNRHVLVEGNKIARVSGEPIEAPGATVIDGAGKTLMPGLIDGHAHIMINAHYDTVEGDMDLGDISIRSIRVARRFLMDGFTSVRDMGGPAFALKRNIDDGHVIGPRIYPSGAFISQTSGHGDFRDRCDRERCSASGRPGTLRVAALHALLRRADARGRVHGDGHGGVAADAVGHVDLRRVDRPAGRA